MCLLSKPAAISPFIVYSCNFACMIMKFNVLQYKIVMPCSGQSRHGPGWQVIFVLDLFPLIAHLTQTCLFHLSYPPAPNNFQSLVEGVDLDQNLPALFSIFWGWGVDGVCGVGGVRLGWGTCGEGVVLWGGEFLAIFELQVVCKIIFHIKCLGNCLGNLQSRQTFEITQLLFYFFAYFYVLHN